ncbi:MAG: beta-ketoacyl-[acyl-carrier-protein] synthase family protein [Planctomycetes bacterium]|nr:beta-ketoacyl-[acyl-carrier-protein] synthase family protein [Planctomycetota bacterium]
MESGREVVVTGLGVVSPIGIGKVALWESFCTQRSGIRNVGSLLTTPLPLRFGAIIPDFDARQYVQPRKSLKVMSREIQTGFAAAQLAIRDAQLPSGSVDPDRLGVVFGSEMLYCELDDLQPAYTACIHDGRFQYPDWGTKGLGQLYPLWMLKYLPNMVACHIGIANDARGPNNTILQGEVSSLLAMIEGARILQRGHADVMIVGGTGSRINVTALLYRGDSNLSHRRDEPEKASRPFDAGRDGMVNGEGAGALVLETHNHALARGGPILARFLGAGIGFHPRGEDQPLSHQGISRSIQLAMREAKSAPDQVGFVKAHGVSTVVDDILEARAIQECLPEVAVTAPKSFFGNLGAGGGAVEAVGAVMALQHDRIPVTLNYCQPDPACPVQVVHGTDQPNRQRSALLLNQSGTGQTAAILLGPP